MPMEQDDAGRGQTPDRAVGAQRRTAIHGDGRDGGGGPHRGGRRTGHSHGGRPAGGAGPLDRHCGGARGARRRPHRLHRDPGHPVAAGAHRPPLRRRLRRAGRSRAGDRHHRIVGRLHPRVPGAVRARRPGGGGAAGLSALSPYPDRARLRAGADRDHAGNALDDHARDADCGPPQDAAQGRADRQPRQSHRHHDGGTSLAGSHRRRRRRGHEVHLRRDLSWPRLCVPGRDRRAAVRQCGDHQLVLENISA